MNNGLYSPAPDGAVVNRTTCTAAWAPVIFGAIAAVAVSVILALLGAGLGFAAASPWEGAGASASALTIEAIIWLIVTQWLASAIAGYLAGRLRAPWKGIHTHDVFFRDTAHGFLSWAVATVFTVLSLASIVPCMSSGMQGGKHGMTIEKHFVTDTTASLLRPARLDAVSAAGIETRGEVSRILMTSVFTKDPVASEDKDYLTRVVAVRGGVSADEAEKQVDTAITNLRLSVDKARKGAASMSIFMALAMVIGAFVAAAAAALGGAHRDDYHVNV